MTAGRAVFCSLGFIILFNSCSIFRKLSFQSISSIQCIRFLIDLYSCIMARFLIGSLTGSLLTSCILVIKGIILVTCRQYSMRICYGSSYISFSKAQSLHLTSAWCTVFTHSYIRFSIIMLISFIKEGVRGIVLGHISRLFYILNYKLRQASHFFLKLYYSF